MKDETRDALASIFGSDYMDFIASDQYAEILRARYGREGKGEGMNKVKVRIAVYVTADGKWNTIGWSEMGPGDHKIALDVLPDGPVSLHWVTAELPIPAPETVEGEVEG